MRGKSLVPSDGRRADFAAPLLRRTACACGGSCPRCAGRLTPGLPLSQPGDALEREADRMAERVLRRAVPGRDECDDYNERGDTCAAWAGCC